MMLYVDYLCLVASSRGVANNGDTRSGILWCHPLSCTVGCKIYFKDSGITVLSYGGSVDSSVTSQFSLQDSKTWKYEQHTSSIRRVTRNLQWGKGCIRGTGSSAPIRRRSLVVWGRALISTRKLLCFCKNNLILG